MEEWEKWTPIDNVPMGLYMKSVVAGESGLILTFLNETKKKEVVFRFSASLFSYRFTEEGCFLKTLDYLYQNYKPEYFQDGSLFKVKNSKYLEWFKEESYDVYNTKDFEHYAFYTEDGIIEVLSPYAPKIEIRVG